MYVHSQSNHPPAVKEAIPNNINNRISLLSCSEKVFNEEKDTYQNALRRSGYDFKMKYDSSAGQKKQKGKGRCRDVCWFNPPWSDSVVTPVGKIFLNIVSSCFPKDGPLYNHFNRATLKMSYSTCRNVKAHVDSHNRNIIQPSVKENPTCNCRIKADCPLAGQCSASQIVYQAKVTEEKSGEEKIYFGQTLRPFKDRYYEHTMAIKTEKSPHATALSNHIWKLKKAEESYKIKWSIKSRAPIYKSGSKICQLCLHEKTAIALCKPSYLLNNRRELLNKCIHKNKFELAKLAANKQNKGPS